MIVVAFLAHLPPLCQFVLIFVSPLVPQCLRSLSLSTLQTELRWVTSYLHNYQDDHLFDSRLSSCIELCRVDKSRLFEATDSCSMTNVAITCNRLSDVIQTTPVQVGDELTSKDQVRLWGLVWLFAIIIHCYSGAKAAVHRTAPHRTAASEDERQHIWVYPDRRCRLHSVSTRAVLRSAVLFHGNQSVGCTKCVCRFTLQLSLLSD